MEAFDMYSSAATSHTHDCQHVLDLAPSEKRFQVVGQTRRNVLISVRSAGDVPDDLVAASGANYCVILPVDFTKFCIVHRGIQHNGQRVGSSSRSFNSARAAQATPDSRPEERQISSGLCVFERDWECDRLGESHDNDAHEMAFREPFHGLGAAEGTHDPNLLEETLFLLEQSPFLQLASLAS